MSNRVVAGFLAAVAISLFLSEAETNAATSSKARKCTAATQKKSSATVSGQKAGARVAHATNQHGRHARTAGLIPPPPAYMPCILPELYYRNTGSGVTEVATTVVKKENPYKQYVSTPNGDAPEALSTRKGVVTWNRRG
jgi:hypothetical protein